MNPCRRLLRAIVAAARQRAKGQARAKRMATAKGNCNDNGSGNRNGCNKLNQADRQAAAARSLQQGALNPLMLQAQAATLIDGAPHYFSHPNYANSPLPTIEGHSHLCRRMGYRIAPTPRIIPVTVGTLARGPL